jgi:Mce-associated membrane protein
VNGLPPPPLPVASLWRRCAAAILDAAIGFVGWILGAMWLLIAVWGFRRTPLELPGAALLILAVLLLAVVLHIVYHTVFLGGCGQTLGRMALGIAVVKRDGRPVGYGRALARTLSGGFDVLTLGLSRLIALGNRERRGLADLIVGTRVVRI